MPESLLAGCTGWQLDCIDGEVGSIVDMATAPGGDEPTYLIVSGRSRFVPSIVPIHVSLVTQIDTSRRRIRVGTFRACLQPQDGLLSPRPGRPAAGTFAASGCGLDHRSRDV